MVNPEVLKVRNATVNIVGDSFVYTHYFRIINNNNDDFKCQYSTDGVNYQGFEILANDYYDLTLQNNEPSVRLTAYFIDKVGKCPNMRWNEPTLREVLNDLCLTKDCLITLKNNKLTPLNISQRGSDFDSDNIIYVNQSQSLEDYTSEIRTNLGNVIDYNKTKNIEYIGWRNDDVAYFSTTKNGVLIKTNRPIYDLIKLTVYIPNATQRAANSFGQEIDMTDYVKEQGVLKSLELGIGVDSLEPIYQKNCAYYTRGSKNISGFDIQTKSGVFFIPAVSVFEQWENIILEKLGEDAHVNDFSQWLFKVEYLSLDTQSYTLSRGTNYNRIRNQRTIYDNQKNSSVEIDRFITFEQNKLDRLSNKAILIQSRCGKNINDIANIFDTYENKYVIFSKELIVDKKSINVDYYACENYVLSNYFTSINSQKRNFDRISNANSVERSEVKKIYYELSFTQPTNQFDFKYIDYDLPLVYLNFANNSYNINLYASSPFIDLTKFNEFYNEDARNIKIETFNNDNELNYSEQIIVGGTLQCVNNIATYNFQLDDNVFAGFNVDYHTASTAQGYPETAFYNSGIDYNCNNNVFKNIAVKLGGHNTIDEAVLSNNDTRTFELSCNLPYNTNNSELQTNEGLAQAFSFPMYKDNAEKLGLSFNFEWVSDSEDIEILEPAENSLYCKIGSKPTIFTQYYNTYYDSDDEEIEHTGLYPTTYNNITTNNGVWYSNGKYYADSSKTTEIKNINNPSALGRTDIVDGFTFVYDLDTNKLLLRNLKYSQTGIVYDKEYEVSSDLGFTYSDVYSSYYLTLNSYTISGATLKLPALYAPTSANVINITGGTGTVNLTTGVIDITPTENEVIINNSVKIHNVNEHLVGGHLKIYLKIKDYYI